ncbi:membrane protein [Alicyclobacillus hesperidum]|uniref:Membrane protein n=2 Tax=Alicyclobacillus hesperidum TaxID=89784 RepID=A0AA37TZD0_9BACL|nr:membrane protein [Alicyclobacillus hesperidum]
MLNMSTTRVLLILLTVVSGCVDAISFLRLGQVFTAAMTGNTVLCGIAVAGGHGGLAVRYAVALIGFAVGAAGAALVMTGHRRETGWSRAVTGTLCLELAALFAFWLLTQCLPATEQKRIVNVLLFVLAFAMGVQGSTARRVGINGITTTVITSTLTGLVETAVWKAVGKVRSHAVTTDGKAFEPTAAALVWMWLSAIVAYGIGAAMSSAIIAKWSYEAVWVPMAIVVIVLLTGHLQGRSQSQQMSM